MSPVDDARAALKLAQQKLSRCKDAIQHGDTDKALVELYQLQLNVEDADAVLSQTETAA